MESCPIVSLNIASHLSFVCKIVNVLLLSVQKWNKSVGYFMPLLSHGNQQYVCQSCNGREGYPILFKSYKKPFSQVSYILLINMSCTSALMDIFIILFERTRHH